MKTIKLFSFLTISSMIILLSNCEKDDGFELGNTQSDFIVDSVYKTSSDGLLFVQLISGAMGPFGALIYAGKTDNPTDTIGKIKSSGAITLPIKKNTYWKVTTYGEYDWIIDELMIQWTPMN